MICRNPIGYLWRLCAAPMAAVFTTGTVSTHAWAQPADLPQGSITLIVPLAAGGPADAIARVLANGLGPKLSRSIVVENRPGAGGNIGAAAVAKATPDGATWLFTVDSVFTVNPSLYKSQGFDPDADLAPIAQVGKVTLMLAVNSKVPVTTWKELLEFGNKSELNFGSAGIGSPGHLAFEYLKVVGQMRAAHVPFRGAAPVLNELIAGNIQAAFVVSGVMTDHVKAGTLRALAVSSRQRLSGFPSVPTAIEAAIKDFEATFSNLLLASAKAAPALRALIGKEVEAVLRQPDVIKRFEGLSTEPSYGGEEVARDLIKRERARWQTIVKAAGIAQSGK